MVDTSFVYCASPDALPYTVHSQPIQYKKSTVSGKLINGILWFFGAYLLLNTVGNLFSPGVIERVVMTPLALVSSILCMVVARARVGDD